MSKMEQTDSSHDIEQPKRKHVREPPQVPFIWEEKPGRPKKNWKPGISSSSPLPQVLLPQPVKLFASVPFTWEEKPGKPLSHFSIEQPESSVSSPKLLSLPRPPMYSHDYGADSNANFDDEIDLESFGFDTDDSFSSAPSLLANYLVSSAATSGAIAKYEIDYPNKQKSSPSSPASESDSSTSSYMTGASSLVGASFLERLFPLLPPDAGFLKRAVANSGEVSETAPETRSKAFDFDGEINSSLVVRKAPTLGELIMMSRRRSCIRKAVEIRKQNLSMEFTKNGAATCCFFASGIKQIERLEWKKFQARLKLV